MPTIDIPPEAARLAVVSFLSFLAGSTVPTYYAQERMRGFGRRMANTLPYEPPPGQSEEEALQDAQAAAEGGPESDGGTDE